MSRITITVHNVDLKLLQKQKNALVHLRASLTPGTPTYDAMSGLIHFLDACTDPHIDAGADPTYGR